MPRKVAQRQRAKPHSKNHGRDRQRRKPFVRREDCTDDAGSQALLEEAERAGLFVVPLDEVRGWWRYHHLFADLLRARLQAEQPGRVPELHRNAAAWYEERGLADDAIRHAVAAGEMTQAARLIEEHFDERFYLHGEVSTVRRWLALLPPELAGSRARLLLARARLALLDGGPAEAEGLLDLAERASPDADQRFEPSAGRASSLLVNVPAAVTLLRVYLAELRGDAETTVDLVPRAMAARREGEAMLGTIIGWYAGMAEWLRGRPAEAERLLSPAVGQRSAAGEGFLAAWVCHVLCQAQRAQGRLDAVVEACTRWDIARLRSSGVPRAWWTVALAGRESAILLNRVVLSSTNG
jgi:LuxR family maltose regulon positive regulatory protein